MIRLNALSTLGIPQKLRQILMFHLDDVSQGSIEPVPSFCIEFLRAAIIEKKRTLNR